MLLKKKFVHNFIMKKKKQKQKQKNSGIQNLSELDWVYDQFQSYINIKFY